MSIHTKYIIKIKVLRGDFLKSKYDEIKERLQNYQGDVGFDLFFEETKTILSGHARKIGLGIATEVVKRQFIGYSHIDKNVPYMLVPRSSIVKTPLRLANSIGIIDTGYRGELMAVVDSHEDFTIRQGERLFQIVLPNMEPISEIELVEELSETDRSEGGFGSSGK